MPHRGHTGFAGVAVVAGPRLFIRAEQRPPPGKPLVGAVVIGDFVLAQAPAEEHLLAVAESREVQEPLVEILDERACRLDPLDAACEGGSLELELLFDFTEVGRRQVAAVGARALRKHGAPGLRLEKPAVVHDHLLDDRAELVDSRIRLLEGEVAWRHPPYCRCLPLEPHGNLARGRRRVPDLRAERPSTGRALGPPGAHERRRLPRRRLGPLGLGLVPADRARRLRRDRAGGCGVLPAVPASRRRARAGPLWPLRPRRGGDFAGRGPGGVPAASPACRVTPGRGGGAACGPLPGDLPFRRLPRRRLQRIPLPARDARELRPRRTGEVPDLRNRGRARLAHAADRHRAPTRSRTGRLEGAEESAGAARAGRGPGRLRALPAVSLVAARRPLRLPDRRRVAPARRAVRALRGAQPGDPAQRAVGAVAAALDPAFRAHRLPALHGACHRRFPPAGAHGGASRECRAPRRRLRTVGPLAMGRVNARSWDRKLLAWCVLVGALIGLAFVSAAAAPDEDSNRLDAIYTYEFGIGGLVLYGI